MEESTSASVNLFGKYELGRFLGYGAFAKVYHARNVSNGQSVAVKAVSKKKIINGGLMALVKREISIMRRLRHPHVIRLYEVLATKTKIYYVLEFAKGGELFAKIARGRFSEDLSRKYFQQLITAVGFCHARGVFHRDLKPENLLLDENWDLKISDFGLSAVKDPTRPNDPLNTLCGTPAYVAPEIIAKKGYDGAKIDIWSCGVILFVLIAGYLPFNDTNLMAMYRKIYKGEYRCPKWTSPELRRLLSRLLDVNPDTRITINEILNDPWFKKDYKEKKFNFIDLELKEHKEEAFLNAFDIIAFAPGVDLTGLNLLKESGISTCSERFVSGDSPETIIERVEEVAKKEEVVTIEKREWGAKFEGKNGKFVMTVEVGRLTEELVVVEIRGKEVLNSVGPSQEIWKHRLRPLIVGLFCEPESSPSG